MAKMNASELCGKKEQLVNEWEKCFEQSVGDVLTDEGLKKFWSGDTSLEEAEAMLTGAAINEFLNALFDEVAGVVVTFGEVSRSKGKKDVEARNDKNDNPFKIVRKKDNQMFDNEFDTKREAEEFILEQVKHSPLTIDDFLIVQVK